MRRRGPSRAEEPARARSCSRPLFLCDASCTLGRSSERLAGGEGGTMARFRMLSIDGGGIRGLIPALVLDAIEQTTKKRIHELFDVIAGTSTGGILAAALSCPAADNRQRARFRAAD